MRYLPVCGRGIADMNFRLNQLAFLLMTCVYGASFAQTTAPAEGESAPAQTASGVELAQAAAKPVRNGSTLEETVVTATRMATTANEAPGAVFVVTQEKMQARNIQSLDQALNNVPGVYNKRSKGLMDTTSSIIMRGMTGEARNLILQDGMPMNSPYTGNVNWGGIAAENYQNAEIALGAASSLYGNHAMGGVVNFVSRMPTQREFNFKLGYGGGLGSDLAMKNLRRGFVSFGDKLANGFSYYASVAGAATDGYRTAYVLNSRVPAGTKGAVPTLTSTGARTYILGEGGNNEWKEGSVTLRAAYALPQNGEARLSYMRNQSHYSYDGDPITYLRQGGRPVFRPGEYTFADGQGKTIEDIVQASVETALGAGRLRLNSGVRRQGTNWYIIVRSGAKLSGTGPGELNSTPTRMTYLDGQYTFSPFDKHLLVVGASLQVNKADNTTSRLRNHGDIGSTAGVISRMGGKTRLLGLFVQDEISVTDKLTTTVGLRWDQIRMSGGYQDNTSYPSVTHSAFSPKVGVRYHVNDKLSLRSSLGRSFRAPSVYDLYRVWYGSGANPIEYGNNPFLKPEKAIGWDIGADFKPWEGAEVKATYFMNRLSDMIFRKDITPKKKSWDNAGKARAQGVELDFRQKLGQNWTVMANATFNHTRMLDVPNKRAIEGKKFQFVPDRMANLGVEFKKGPFDASAWLQHVSKRYANDMNSDVVNGVSGSRDPYTLVNLKAGYQITKNVKASLSIDNAFNRKYFDVTSRAPGRSYYLELSGKF